MIRHLFLAILFEHAIKKEKMLLLLSIHAVGAHAFELGTPTARERFCLARLLHEGTSCLFTAFFPALTYISIYFNLHIAHVHISTQIFNINQSLISYFTWSHTNIAPLLSGHETSIGCTSTTPAQTCYNTVWRRMHATPASPRAAGCASRVRAPLVCLRSCRESAWRRPACPAVASLWLNSFGWRLYSCPEEP